MAELNKMDKIRLSVIDDHPIIFWGIKMVIKKCKADIQLVGHYICGADIVRNLDDINSDVLLIDMCLPDVKGYDLIPRILELYPTMKIGMYSNMLYRQDILNSFRNGALGYLSKFASAEEIIDFIYTIARGEKYVRGEIADIVFKSDLFQEKKSNNITKRELEILQLIVEGFRNREIAYKLSISERTVEFHKQNIYLKMEVNNSVDLVKKALSSNLVSNNEFWR